MNVKPWRRLAILTILTMTSTGCSMERWRAFHQCRADQAEAKAEALRMETEALRSECHSRSEALRSEYDETLKTQLGLPVGQQIELGQLQVDEQKLMDLLSARKKQQEALKQFYDDYEKKRQEKLQEALKTELAEALKQNDHQAATDAINKCCLPKPPTCAQVEKLQDIPPRVPEALKQPLLPTEIPFVLPVTVRMEMGNPTIGPSRVERLRTVPEKLQDEPCCPTKCCPPQQPCTECRDANSAYYETGLPLPAGHEEPTQAPPFTNVKQDNLFENLFR